MTSPILTTGIERLSALQQKGNNMARHRKWMKRIALLALLFLSATETVPQSIRIAGLTKPVPHAQVLSLILTVSASPASVSFQLNPGGIATGSTSVAITSSCVLSLGLPTQFTLYGYFPDPNAALASSSPAASIPASDVLGTVPTGTPTTYTTFTQTNPLGAAGGSLLLWQTASDLCLLGSRTDNLNLQINLNNLPQLPAGNYTGTLVLEAQAI